MVGVATAASAAEQRLVRIQLLDILMHFKNSFGSIMKGGEVKTTGNINIKSEFLCSKFCLIFILPG